MQSAQTEGLGISRFKEGGLPRVLAICLDGYEEFIGRPLIMEGRMPALRAPSEVRASGLIMDQHCELA
jgi:hypothetical protein